VGFSWFGLLGCAPEFPRKLFVVEAPNAGYPVMVSRVKGVAPGRVIGAASGTTESVGGNMHSWGRSEMNASEKFAAQVARTERWVQIQGVEYSAEDVYATIAASENWHVTILGTAQR
jgi:hypothetical protein